MLTRWTSKVDSGPRTIALIAPTTELEDAFLDQICAGQGNRRTDPEGLCTWITLGEHDLCLVRARGANPIGWGCSAAILTFNSAEGIDGSSIERWSAALESGLPGLAFVAGLEDFSSDFDESAAVIRRISETHVPAEPIVAPLLADDESVAGFLDLLGMRIWLNENGQEVERHCDPEHLSVTSEARERLMESILLATTDDAAVMRAIDESLDPVSISALLVNSVRAGELVPILGWGGMTGASIARAAIAELISGGPGNLLPDVMSCAGEPTEPLSMSHADFATAVSSHAFRVWSGSFATNTNVIFGCEGSELLIIDDASSAIPGHIMLTEQPLPAAARTGISSPTNTLTLMED